MTLEEIVSVAKKAGVESAAIEQSRVLFCESFECGEDEEPHDMAWDLGCLINDQLQRCGLQTKDKDSDNDSVFGEIVEA